MVIFPSGMSGAYAQILLRWFHRTWFVLIYKCFLHAIMHLTDIPSKTCVIGPLMIQWGSRLRNSVTYAQKKCAGVTRFELADYGCCHTFRLPINNRAQ
jgi:hypothetical protein